MIPHKLKAHATAAGQAKLLPQGLRDGGLTFARDGAGGGWFHGTPMSRYSQVKLDPPSRMGGQQTTGLGAAPAEGDAFWPTYRWHLGGEPRSSCRRRRSCSSVIPTVDDRLRLNK
jgi:hypothetical protein